MCVKQEVNLKCFAVFIESEAQTPVFELKVNRFHMSSLKTFRFRTDAVGVCTSALLGLFVAF